MVATPPNEAPPHIFRVLFLEIPSRVCQCLPRVQPVHRVAILESHRVADRLLLLLLLFPSPPLSVRSCYVGAKRYQDSAGAPSSIIAAYYGLRDGIEKRQDSLRGRPLLRWAPASWVMGNGTAGALVDPLIS